VLRTHISITSSRISAFPLTVNMVGRFQMSD
jgi:hypothetical protein